MWCLPECPPPVHSPVCYYDGDNCINDNNYSEASGGLRKAGMLSPVCAAGLLARGQSVNIYGTNRSAQRLDSGSSRRLF